MSDEDLIDYFDLVESWALRLVGTREDWNDPLRYLTRGIQTANPKIGAAVRCRHASLTEQDREFARPFVEGGGFSFFGGDLDAALLSLSRDLQLRRDQMEFSRRFERYSPDTDALFRSSPVIRSDISKRGEMVALSSLRQIDRSAEFVVVSSGSGTGNTLKLATILDPEIVCYVRDGLSPGASVELRLDPDFPAPVSDPPAAAYTQSLPACFREMLATVPLASFLRPRARVLSQLGDIRANPQEALEYFSGGLRRLECSGSRSEGRVEIYLEEVVDESPVRFGEGPDELVHASEGSIVGRVIHCDTYAADETACEDVQLCHLDLAIYRYEGEVGQKRLLTPIASRVEASDLIHVFKVAPIALDLLPGIAWLFFKRSRRHLIGLARELCSAQ